MSYQFTRKATIKRFWKKVKKTDTCWLWIGSVNWAGYGRFTADDPYTEMVAHRYSYMLVHGKLLNHLQLHHICRNTSCVNPNHLIVMTGTEHRQLEAKMRVRKSLKKD